MVTASEQRSFSTGCGDGDSVGDAESTRRTVAYAAAAPMEDLPYWIHMYPPIPQLRPQLFRINRPIALGILGFPRVADSEKSTKSQRSNAGTLGVVPSHNHHGVIDAWTRH